jgi:ERCC4-related helicase
MAIENEPFIRTRLEEEERPDSFTIRLNKEEREQLNNDKRLLRQPKDSTAIKQLASIGSKVIHDPKMAELLDIVIENTRKNKRIGINEVE